MRTIIASAIVLCALWAPTIVGAEATVDANVVPSAASPEAMVDDSETFETTRESEKGQGEEEDVAADTDVEASNGTIEKFAKEAKTPSANTGKTPLEKLDGILSPVNFGGGYFALVGYIQPGFIVTQHTRAYANDDQEMFVIKNARLAAKAKLPIHKQFSIGASAEISMGDGNVELVSATGTFGFWEDRMMLDVGQQRVSYSMYRHISDKYVQLARPESSQPSIHALRGRREPGVRLRLYAPLADKGELTWYTSITNGDGPNNFRNEDSKFYYATFVDIAPLGEMSWAMSDLNNSEGRFSFGGSAAYNPSVGPNSPEFLPSGKQRRFAAHGRMEYRGFSLGGEYLHIRQDIPGEERPTFFRGGVLQAGYVLPVVDFPQIEVVGRYQRLNFNQKTNGFEGVGTPVLQGDLANNIQVDDMHTQIYELGLNFFFLDHRAKIQLNYRITDVIDKGYDYQPVEGGVPVVDGNGDPVIVRETLDEQVIGQRLLIMFQFGAF